MIPYNLLADIEKDGKPRASGDDPPYMLKWDLRPK